MRTFDYSKLSTVLWDSELLSLVAQIHECKGRQELYLHQKPAVMEKLVDLAKIQSTQASNQIEGIVTTNTRLQQLYNEKTSPRNRNEEEILGYRDVLNTIHENYEYIPLKSSYILQLHRDLYQYSGKSIGGTFKNTQNYIAKKNADGSEEVLFTPIAPYETPSAVESICENFNVAHDKAVVDPLILIPIFINDFLCIHPFNDGNGRMSRLLTALLLYRCGYVVGRYISLEAIIEKNKSGYYNTLLLSDEGWYEGTNDPTPFIKYFLGIVLFAYREFENRVNIIDEKLPAIELVRKAIQKKYGKFTKSEIAELVPTISKSSIENSLKKLAEEGYIEKKGGGRSTYYIRKD